LLETKFIQKRTGVVFPDAHNNFNTGRGHRPYVPDPYFRNHRYHENNNDFINFRNKNGHQGDHELPGDKYRQKYRPGLLGVSVGRLGAVVVTDPDGYKHVIHNLPPWTALETEREHHRVSFPGNIDFRGGLENPGSRRFSAGIHGNTGGYDYQKHHHQTYKEMPTYSGSITSAPGNKSNSQFVAVHTYFLKSHNENRTEEQGPLRDTSGILHQTDDRKEQDHTTPLKLDKFHPSPPFHRYSDPDPLYHPNGSSLQTYLFNKPTQLPTTTPSTTNKPLKTTQIPASKKHMEYPDSINAQLPLSGHETNVPYVAVTAVTEQMLRQHETAATQASDATSLTQALPTHPSIHRLIKSEVPLSTVRENNTSMPDSLVLETSSHPAPVNVSAYLTQTARKDNNMKTEHFLPTIITEKPEINPHQTTEPQIYYTTEPSHSTIQPNTATSSSPQEIHNSYIMERSGAENKNYSVYGSAMTLPQSSNMSTAMPDIDTVSETNTMKSQAASATTENVYNLTKTNTEENSDMIQALKSESEDIQPTAEIYKTDQVTEKDMVDAVPTVESNVTKSTLSMSIQLQTIVNHVQSLNYLHHDSSTTFIPTDKEDW
jgi:hypothetical protein